MLGGVLIAVGCCLAAGALLWNSLRKDFGKSIDLKGLLFLIPACIGAALIVIGALLWIFK